ncbi:unnamed protein product, partial [Discosporangium mesarthrocarpum]
MHSNPWTPKTRAWGFDVIRGIAEDDPKRVIQAFRHPAELAFVDINSQVERDYGGYVWTEWMHNHFGDTALHLAVKWKRHRAVKAILSLRPDWTLPNEAGQTAADLCYDLYRKDMKQLKQEQEIEYENNSMQEEEDAMRSLLAAAEKERLRKKEELLARIKAQRTKGVADEAYLLLTSSRVLVPESMVTDGPVAASTTATATTTTTITTSLYASSSRRAAHVCRQLRRNRFAAQRGEMRRNVLPTEGVGQAVEGSRASPSRSTSPLRSTTLRAGGALGQG